MDTGWIKLYRKSIESRVFQNEGLWKLWCICLMKANHKEGWFNLDGSIDAIKVKPGEFITGRFSLHKDYYPKKGKNQKSPLTLWRWLQLLEKYENLNIKTNNKYSVITIMNWDTYQITETADEQQNEQQVNNERTTSEQQVNTNKNVKNVKNEENVKKKNKHTLPKDFSISEGVIKWAAEKGHTNLEEHLENFIIKSKAKKYKYVDWDSAFQGAIRDNWANLKSGKSNSTFNNLHTKDYGENKGDGTEF